MRTQKTNLKIVCLAAACGLAMSGHANAQYTARISELTPSGQAMTGGSNPHISSTGRFIAFATTTAIVASDTNGTTDIYVRDRLLNTTSRISMPDPGMNDSDANGYSGLCHNGARCMSDDGRFVIFHSAATDLVSGDTNEVEDIFVRDRDADGNGIFDEPGAGKTRTRRVNLTSSEGQSTGSCPNQTCTHQSYNGTISSDGRYVAWESNYDFTPDNAAFSNIYWRDRDADGDGILDESGSAGLVDQAVTELVSKVQVCVNCTYDGFSSKAAISGDGRWVAFESVNTHLVFSDTNNASDIFVRDVVSNTTVRASTSSNEVQDTAGSFSPSISDNGRVVAFSSTNDFSAGGNGLSMIWERTYDDDGDGNYAEAGDDSLGLVSMGHNVLSNGYPLMNGACSVPCVSGNGRVIAYASDATNFSCGVSCEDQNAKKDVFVWNFYASGRRTERASEPSNAALESNGDSTSPSLTYDGTAVGFSSVATNMVTPDSNGATGDAFVRAGVTSPVNSDCVSAQFAPIGPGAESISGETTGSAPGVAPMCVGTMAGPAQWFTYTPTCTGQVTINTFGSSFDTILSVHTDCPPTPLNTVACNDDSNLDGPNFNRSLVSFTALGGVEYKIQVTGFNLAHGLFTLNLTPVIPTNNECAGAQVVSNGTSYFGTCQATSGGPAQSGTGTMTNDVWFRYTATCSGVLSLDTCGSSFDTVMAVYATSCPATANTAVAVNDDALNSGPCAGPAQRDSYLTMQVQQGQDYLIRIGGYNPLAIGDGVLTIACEAPPACPCDWNMVDGLDSQDFFDFLDGFFQGNADFNGVDGTDSQDYFEFLECFFTGC